MAPVAAITGVGLVELASLESLGVGWREATYLANPRLKVDADATFVSLKLTERGASVVDVNGGGANYDAAFTGEDTRSSHLRFLVHVSMHDRRCRDAAVLFVDVDAQRGLAVAPATTPFRDASHTDGTREPWLADVYDHLIFCDYKHREKRRVALVGAAFECGGRDPRGTQNCFRTESARWRETASTATPVDVHAGQNAGKRKLADDMRKKMLRRAGKLPKVVEPVREGRGSLSVEGRRRAAVQFASSLKDDVKHEAHQQSLGGQFGPYPDAFAHALRLLGARACQDC